MVMMVIMEIRPRVAAGIGQPIQATATAKAATGEMSREGHLVKGSFRGSRASVQWNERYSVRTQG